MPPCCSGHQSQPAAWYCFTATLIAWYCLTATFKLTCDGSELCELSGELQLRLCLSRRASHACLPHSMRSAMMSTSGRYCRSKYRMHALEGCYSSAVTVTAVAPTAEAAGSLCCLLQGPSCSQCSDKQRTFSPTARHHSCRSFDTGCRGIPRRWSCSTNKHAHASSA